MVVFKKQKKTTHEDVIGLLSAFLLSSFSWPKVPPEMLCPRALHCNGKETTIANNPEIHE